MWVKVVRRWHHRPLSHLTIFQRSCCCILVVKVAVSFCESTSRCGLKISCPAYSHLATVEECDNTAGEVLVVTVFYLVGSVISQFGLETLLEERDHTWKIRIYFRIVFKLLLLALELPQVSVAQWFTSFV